MTFAIALALSAVLSSGLGAWWRGPSRAAPVLAGQASATVLLLAANLVFGLPLHQAALGLAGLAVLGLAWRGYRDGMAGGWRLACHPVAALPLAVAVLSLWRGEVPYLPYSWDEFSAWVTWPREAFAADRIAAPGAFWLEMGYPQGFPALAVLPQLFFDRFDAIRLLAPLVVMHAALMGLAYEAVRDHLRQSGWDVQSAALASWAAVLALLGVEAAWTLIPQLMVVEKPQIYLFAAIVLLLVQAERHAKDAPRLWVAAGLCAGLAYLVKATSLALVPPLAVALALILADQGARRAALAAAAILGPVAAAWLFWRLAAPTTAMAGCAANPLAVLSGSHASSLAGIAARVGHAAASYAAGFKLPLTVAALAALALAWRHRPLRPALAVVTVWGVLHLVGLVWSYGYCFGAYESEQLASLPRYLRLLLRVVHVCGLTLLAAAVLGWARDRVISGRYRTAALVLVLAVFAVVQVRAIGRSLTNVGHRTYETPATVAQVAQVTAAGEALARLLAERGRQGAEVLMIVQDGQGFEQVIARQVGMGTVRGERWRFRLKPGIAFGPEAATPWTRPMTPESMRALLLAHEVVWPLAVDPWMRSRLAEVVADPACAAAPERYYLLRRPAGDGFDCVSG